MAVIKGAASAAEIAAHAAVAATPQKILVRLKSRSILEPGCITVEPGHVMEIPESHFDAQHHERLSPPAVAQAPAAGPPAASGEPQPSADAGADLQ
jgi:hypothetical protein